MHEYVIRLQQKAKYCEFGDDAKNQIRDQVVVDKWGDTRVKQKWWNRTLWTLINPVLSSQLDESGIRVLTLVAMLTTVTLSVGVVTVVEQAQRQVVTPVLVERVIGVARADIFNGTALIRMWLVLKVKMSDIMPMNVKPKMWKWVNHITNLRNSRFVTLLNQNPIIPVMRHFTFLPEASFGLRVLSLAASVCPSVCVCGNHLLVRTITCRAFKLESPNLDHKSKTPWLRSLLFWGVIDLELQGQI